MDSFQNLCRLPITFFKFQKFYFQFSYLERSTLISMIYGLILHASKDNTNFGKNQGSRLDIIE